MSHYELLDSNTPSFDETYALIHDESDALIAPYQQSGMQRNRFRMVEVKHDSGSEPPLEADTAIVVLLDNDEAQDDVSEEEDKKKTWLYVIVLSVILFTMSILAECGLHTALILRDSAPANLIHHWKSHPSDNYYYYLANGCMAIVTTVLFFLLGLLSEIAARNGTDKSKYMGRIVLLVGVLVGGISVLADFGLQAFLLIPGASPVQVDIHSKAMATGLAIGCTLYFTSQIFGILHLIVKVVGDSRESFHHLFLGGALFGTCTMWCALDKFVGIQGRVWWMAIAFVIAAVIYGISTAAGALCKNQCINKRCKGSSNIV